MYFTLRKDIRVLSFKLCTQVVRVQSLQSILGDWGQPTSVNNGENRSVTKMKKKEYFYKKKKKNKTKNKNKNKNKYIYFTVVYAFVLHN